MKARYKINLRHRACPHEGKYVKKHNSETCPKPLTGADIFNRVHKELTKARAEITYQDLDNDYCILEAV